MAASAIPKRVPLGFVCGHPVGYGGELYGGSMFIRSAASDTLQGKAIQSVNEKWGVEDSRHQGWRSGLETIGIAVCKKKYAPFSFSVSYVENSNGERKKKITVKRMYGCHCHSDIRKAKIEKYGERKGWEPFGQWSLRKVRKLAKNEMERQNRQQPPPLMIGDSINSGTATSAESSSDESRDASSEEIGRWVSSTPPLESDEERHTKPDSSILSLCNNGRCTWKVKTKYDNITDEINNNTGSEHGIRIE